MRVLVTGGAGFIGSHVTDLLVSKEHEVIIIDNLSCGKIENVNPKAKFIKKDLTDQNISSEIQNYIKNCETIFHFAADAHVSTSAVEPEHTYRNNVTATMNVLEICRKFDIKNIVFSSTSTVYGEPKTIPTPEDHYCQPISNYGASKLACEAFCSSYSDSYGIKATILRYANIFGERSLRGLIHDVYKKIKKDSKHVELLGNGKQEKSYMYIKDCVSATMLAWEKQNKNFDVFNVGSEKKLSVDEVVDKICSSLKVSPEFTYTGSDRGWTGDVRKMQLDIKKIKSLGWKEEIAFNRGLDLYLDWIRGS